MATLISSLVFFQALGASIGAITAVWGELAYIRLLRDGHLDGAERAHLDIIAKGLRFGMTILLIASLGLVVAAYVSNSAIQPALSSSYWTLVIFSLLIIGVSWSLSHRHISFAFGSSIIFTSWWFLAYLTLGWISPLSFGSSVAFLVVSTAVIYALLRYIRMLAGHLAQKEN